MTTSQIIRLELHVDSSNPLSRQEAADLLAKDLKGKTLFFDKNGSEQSVTITGGVVVHVSGSNAGQF